MERKALKIVHGLDKFHYYCYASEVSIIINHKPLGAILKKEVATLSQTLQYILLRTHQYRIRVIYMPGPELFMVNFLS